jgi:hypothetical protein
MEVTPKQVFVSIELLTPVLVRLPRSGNTRSEQHAVRVVMIGLLNGSACTCNHSVVAQVVLQVEIVGTVFYVPAIYQDAL